MPAPPPREAPDTGLLLNPLEMPLLDEDDWESVSESESSEDED